MVGCVGESAISIHPVLITGDLKQAFLQVRMAEKDCNALRFHWFEDLLTKTIEVLRFTRAVFGLAIDINTSGLPARNIFA